MNLKEMNYENFIKSAVEKGRDLNRESGYEIHHIQPRSLGGSDDDENLVKLTYLEHLIAHYLLARDSDSFDMARAFFMMLGENIKKVNKEDLKNLNEEDLLELSLVREKALEKSREETSKRMHEFYKNPENRKAFSERIRKWWSIQENRESRLSENHPAKKESVKIKFRKNMADRWDLNNEKYENYRIKTCERLKNLANDPEVRKRVTDAVSLYFNDPEIRQSVSKRMKDLWRSPGYRKHYIENCTIRGRKVYTNKDRDILLKDGEEIPEGFSKGSKKSDYRWFNNGEINTRVKDCPEGFYEGFISHRLKEKELKLIEKELEASNAHDLYNELKYGINEPLNLISYEENLGSITKEEADKLRSEIYSKREVILKKYEK